MQPVVGLITDRKAAPYFTSNWYGIYIFWFNKFSICSKLSNNSYFCSFNRYWVFNISSRSNTYNSRYAAGNRQGFAQGIFQVGGQTGGALGPIFAAIILVPWGLSSLSIFATFALLAMILLVWIGSKQHEISIEFLKIQKDKKNKNELKNLSPVHNFL